MTLPAALPLSMSQVAAEIGASLPLDLLDGRVIGLSGKSGAPISLSDLLGKTGSVTMNLTGNGSGSFREVFFGFPNPLFLDGTLVSLSDTNGDGATIELGFSRAPSIYTGRIIVKNNTTAASAILSYIPASSAWGGSGGGGLLVPAEGVTQNISVYPSN